MGVSLYNQEGYLDNKLMNNECTLSNINTKTNSFDFYYVNQRQELK
jgi:hypothetical protein